MAINPSISNVLDRVNLVVFQTRIVTPIRDTGEGRKEGSRIEKVLQACFDPAVLRPLTRKKQEATRICRSFGTRVETLNAWAVPAERTQDLMEQLARISKEWDDMAEELARNISTRVEAWATQNAAERDAIKSLAPSDLEVRATTRFIYTSFRLRGADVDDNGCLEADLSGLAGQTLHELAVALRDASLDKATGEHYTQSVKDVLGRLARKAESLAFLDPRIGEVSTVLTSTIAMLPANGLITAAHAVLVKSVVDQMLNPRRLMRDGFAKIERPKQRVVAPASSQAGQHGQASVPLEAPEPSSGQTFAW